MSYEQMLAALGWITFWNVVVLAVSALLVIPLKNRFSRIHARMFGLEPDVVRREYFRFLASYEIIVLAFFVVPYLVLRFSA